MKNDRRKDDLLQHASVAKVSPGMVKAIVAVALVVAVVAIVRWAPIASGTEFEITASEEQTSDEGEDGTDESSEEYVLVHVVGAVESPGVYSLVAGSRVNDAVEAAGGFTDDASTSSTNLAREVVDGEQIVIYTEEEAQTASTSTSSTSSSTLSSSSTTLININTATVDELQELSGIGPSLAQAIVDYRTQNGNFSSIEEIKEVSGIGDSRYANICDSICV